MSYGITYMMPQDENVLAFSFSVRMKYSKKVMLTYTSTHSTLFASQSSGSAQGLLKDQLQWASKTLNRKLGKA